MAYNKDKAILRELALRFAETTVDAGQPAVVQEWKRLNSLKPGRSMLWICEIPWHEMNVDNELTLQCIDPFCRQQETILRRALYQWRHMRADMITEAKIYSPLSIQDSGFGITEDTDHVITDAANPVISRHFKPQIASEDDLEKIRIPVVEYNTEESEKTYEQMQDLFGDILAVERQGIPGFWFAPIDLLIKWWGVQELLTDLIMQPELLHKTIQRLVDACIHRLEQYEALRLLSLNNGFLMSEDNPYHSLGSGGIGLTDELPALDFDGSHVRIKDLWGCSSTQIFSEVSPAMHEEFALYYEIQWLKRFGLTYYGCCEPLHKKIEIIKKIPNLRKISMSRWVNIEQAAEYIGASYVFSYKPNPGIFAAEHWDINTARNELKDVLDKTKGCVLEIIMKDISTVRYSPQRLWEWVQMAIELVQG